MKTTVTAICAFFITLFSLQAQSYIPNQVIFQFNPNTSQAYRQDLIDEIDGTLLEDDEADPAIIGENVLIGVSLPVVFEGETINSEVDLIGDVQRSKAAGLNSTSLNYTLTTSPLSFSGFLGQNNLDTYSPIGTSCEASYPGGSLQGSLSYTQASVKVAILDTGLDPYYPTINQYVTEEINVLTDDNGGAISVNETYDPNNSITIDDNGHGTAVAGVLAGLCSRAGVHSDNLDIMIVKCFDANGYGSLYNMVQAVTMAERLGADVLNLSWSYAIDAYGEEQEHQTLEQLLRIFSNEDDGIIVTGAGNDGGDLDVLNLGPANFEEINNLITVGGVVGSTNGCDGSKANFSNEGSNVDIFAPAESMQVPSLNGYWKTDADGTSFATPIVTAAVVCAWINYYGNPVTMNYFSDTNPVVTAVVNGATIVESLKHDDINKGVVNFTNTCSGLYYDETNVPIGGGNTGGGNGRGASYHNFLQNTHGSSNTATSHNINQPKQALNIQASPNPFNASFSINLPTSINSRRVELLNIGGQQLLSKQVDSQSTTVRFDDLNHLPQGVYVLKIHDGQSFHQQLIIKQ